VFIASPILIYLGVGTGRQYVPDTPEEKAVESPPTAPARTPVAARARR
jgi:hypothetical protein